MNTICINMLRVTARFKNYVSRSVQTSQLNRLSKNSSNCDDLDSSVFNLNKVNKKSSEIQQFVQDIEKLSLHETIEKYGISVKEACELNNYNEKRVVLSGLINYVKVHSHQTTIALSDGKSAHTIYMHIPTRIIQNRENLKCGGHIVGSGFAIQNPKKNENFFICDHLIFSNEVSKAVVKDVKHNIFDFYNSRQSIHFRPRYAKYASAMRLRSNLINDIHSWMHKNQFYHIQPPTLTSFTTELDVFLVEPAQKETYFEKPVYLTSGAELHLESMVSGLPKIYSISQEFHAIERRSKDLSSERYILEVAQAGDFDLQTIMDQLESLIKNVLEDYDCKFNNEFDLILDKRKNRFLNKLNNKSVSFIRLPYNQAIEFLEKKNLTVLEGEKLTSFHLKTLSDYFENFPIFLYDLPNDNTKFNVKVNDSKQMTFELIFPKGFRAGSGSIKETDVKKICKNLKEIGRNGDIPNLDWYIKNKELGNCPSYGFKLNIDTLFANVVNLPSLRDAITFPRMPKYCPM